MSRLKELGQYKNTILAKIISNQNLMKAIVYNVPNFLDQPPVPDVGDQIYDRLWPFKYVPKTVEEEKTFITLSLTNIKPSGPAFKVGMMVFHIFTNVNLMRTEYGVTRVDYIQSEIDEMFNESRDFGIGKLAFHELNELVVTTNPLFAGSILVYKNMDFN